MFRIKASLSTLLIKQNSNALQTLSYSRTIARYNCCKFSTVNNGENIEQQMFKKRIKGKTQLLRGREEKTITEDDLYTEKFGKVKPQLLDSWLEMSSETLQKECLKYGVKTTEMHIDNIQGLFEYIKVFDVENKGKVGLQRHSVSIVRKQSGTVSSENNMFHNQEADIKKEEEFMKSELDRIFSRKRKAQQQIDDEQIIVESGKEIKEEVPVQQKKDQDQKSTPVFNFGLNALKQKLKQRGEIIEAFKPLYQSSGSAQINTQENRLIDIIFGMSTKDLDKQFQKCISPDSAVSKMNLTKEDFDNIPSLSKKKILINMVNISDSTCYSANSYISTLPPNLQIKVAGDGWPSLNQETKNMMRKQIKDIESAGLKSRQLQDIDYVKGLTQVLDNLGLSKQSPIKESILDFYLEKGEALNLDGNIRKTLKTAHIISFLKANCSDQEKISQVQNIFYSVHRKNFNKRNLRALLFYEKIELLKALPMVEGFYHTHQKPLNQLILDDLLTFEKDNWELLNKETTLMLVEKCLKFSNSKDLNNKLRGCLLTIDVQDYSLDDFHKLFKKLAEDKENKLDIKLVQQLLMRKNLKTISYVANKEEFHKHIEFYDFIYNTNPLFFAYQSSEMKQVLFRAQQLGEQEHLSFQDMVKFAKIFVPSLFKPQFYFNELISSHDQSFKKDVNNKDLLELVDQMTKRVSDGEISFEHLAMSTSKLHNFYRPYTEKTFLLFQRILRDLLESSKRLNEDELKIIFKIFQNELVVTKLFTNSEQAVEIVKPVLDNRIEQLNEQISHYSKEYKGKDMIEQDEREIDWDYLKDNFNAATYLQPLISSSPELVQKSKQLIISSLELLTNQILNSQVFTLDQILELNKAVLRAVQSYPEGRKYYEQTSPLSEIVQVILEHHFLQLKTHMHRFVKYKKNIKMSRIIQMEVSNALMSKHIGSLLKYLTVTNSSENHKELSKLVTGSIKNGRSLRGEELLDLFKLVDKYGLLDSTRQLIMNVASNLQTIEQAKIQMDFGDHTDANFQKEQDKRDDIDNENKRLIFNKYKAIYQEDPQLVVSNENVLGSLSQIVADILPDFSDQEVILCLKMLGSKKVENYGEQFIKVLYEKYSSPAVIESMKNQNQKVFFEFAKNWPHFLKNNAILSVLMQTKGTKTLVADQSESLQILANKNVLHPELIDTHFEMFLKMKDKENVAKYLKIFLNSCAYLGYSNFDVAKLTQVFRRIYKTPDHVEMSQLLDYYVILALSNVYYHDFDEKSVEFVQKGLDLIEGKFQGIEALQFEQKDEISGDIEKMSVNYYKPILTQNKVYNKVLIQSKQPLLNFKKAIAEFSQASSSDSSSEEDADETIKKGKSAIQEEDISSEEEEVDPLIKKAIKLKHPEQRDEPSENLDGLIAEETVEPQFSNVDQQQSQLDAIAEKSGKKIFDRKARESQYSEELEFHNYRKKKLQDLDKKSKHLLLFSNINQLNFVDINENELVKAWIILFHFKSKSFDSLIYDEFESITMRNTIGKSKGHELFTKFYLKMIEKSYDNGYRVNVTTKCEKTGWPLDISLSLFSNMSKKLGMFFFLQEELCYNPVTQKEEPLAMQKLMLKHLTNISDYNVEYVTENDFYMSKENVDDYIDQFLRNKLGIEVKEHPEKLQ